MATPIEGGGVQGTGPDGGESSPGQNPAWGEALGAIPEQFHSVLTPHFQKWDQSAQERIEQANAKVKDFEPFQQFVDVGVTAEDLAQGYQLLYQLNQDPQAVYNALKEAYKFDASGPVGQEEEGEEEEAPNFQDPRFDQLQQGLDLVAQTLLQQEQQKIAAQADAKLDAEIQQMEQKYGPSFNHDFFLSVMANGFTAEEAAQKYEQMVQGILQQNPRPFAPQVMGNNGGGTGLPSQAIDPTKLSGPDRRNLVAQLVARQMAE